MVGGRSAEFYLGTRDLETKNFLTIEKTKILTHKMVKNSSTEKSNMMSLDDAIRLFSDRSYCKNRRNAGSLQGHETPKKVVEVVAPEVKKSTKRMKISKEVKVDSIILNPDCPKNPPIEGSGAGDIRSYVAVEQRSWKDVDYSINIVLWAKSVHKRDDLDHDQALFYDMLTSDVVSIGDKKLFLGVEGSDVSAAFDGEYNKFCKGIADAINCDVDEVIYAIERKDWSSRLPLELEKYVTPSIMEFFKTKWCDDGSKTYIVIQKAMTQRSFHGVQFGKSVRETFNQVCLENDEPVYNGRDKDLAGKDYFDIFCILASRDMGCYPSEVSNLLHHRLHKIIEIRSPEFAPIRKWMESVTESGSFGLETAAFYRLCNGKKARMSGQKLPPGKDFIKAIEECFEGTDFTYEDYVYTIKKATGIKSKLIRRVIENGPGSFDSVTEIEKPVVVNVDDEKEFSFKEYKEIKTEKDEWIDENKGRNIHARNSNKVKNVLYEATEWWPVDKTQKLAVDLARDPKVWIFFDVIQTSVVSECKNYYLVDTEYRYSESRDSGRVYADGPSFQSLNGPMRRFLCDDNHSMSDDWVLKDIDIDNCFPVILNQIGKRHGIELNAMIEYVQNREQVLRDAMRLYNCDRKLAKKIFLIEMHGGHFWKEMCTEHGFTRQILSRIKFPFMDRFKKDIKTAFDKLKVVDEFKDLYASIEQDKTKRNKKGTFISYICQDVESMVITKCIEFCEKYQYDLSTLVFDGFMVRWATDDSVRAHKTMDEFLRAVEGFILAECGYDLGFSNKPLKMEDKDYKRLAPKEIEQIDYFGSDTKVIELEDMPTVLTDKGPRRVMHDIDDKRRCTVVTAGMYIGKSTTTYNYLRARLQDPTKTAIAISVRKQHSRTIMGQLGGLGFVHYQQDSKIHGRYVVQYESLHKVFESITEGGLKYDYVILDESHSIIKNMVSETNKRNLKRAEQTFRMILQLSKKVIALDADNLYDRSAQQYLSGVFDRGDIEHLWYKHQALKRKVIYTDQSTMLRSIQDDMENNRNVMICFKSCERLNNWLEHDISGQYYTNSDGKKIQLKLGLKYGVRSFSSHSTSEEMKVFENINDLPRDGLFMAFTSKVLVGADILIPFHRLYLDGHGFRGPTARQMIQMLGRGRVCQTGEIMVTLPLPRKTSMKQKALEYETLYKSQFKDLEKMREKRSEYVNTILSEHKFRLSNGNIEWTPEPILNVYAHLEVERSREFTVEFHRLINIKGYEAGFKFRQTDVVDELSQKFDWKLSLADLRERKNLKLSEALESIQEMDIRTIIDSCAEIKEKRQEASKSEQIINDVLFVCKMIPEHYKNIDLPTAKYMIRNKHIIYMALDMKSADDPKIYLRDIISMKYAAIPELAKLRGTFIKRLDRLLKAVGFSGGILDRETEILESQLGEKLAKHSSELEKLKSDRGSHGRVRSKKNTNVLRSELKMVGLTLKSHVKRHSKESWSTKYTIEMHPIMESIIPHVRRNYDIVADHSEAEVKYDVVDRGDDYIENALSVIESEDVEDADNSGPLGWKHIHEKVNIQNISVDSALGELRTETKNNKTH